jgi:gliding motility-associated-like protein
MKARFLIVLVLLMITFSCYSQITITFRVDMAGQNIGPGGVHIAGQFATNSAISITQEWQPGAVGSLLTQFSGSIYQVEVIFPASAAGRSLQFEFVRNNIWFGSEDYSEGNPNDLNAHINNSCGTPDGSGGFNRMFIIPACDAQFNTVWNFCGTLTSSPLPMLNVSPDSIICPNRSIQLHAITDGDLIWTASNTLSCSTCVDPIASPLATTIYFVKASMGSCIVKDSILITVDTSKVYAGSDQIIIINSNILLTASGVASYLWQPTTGLTCNNCSSTLASPVVTTTYIVQGISNIGCKSFDTMVVYVTKPICENIFFPTAFTPNNDNINETFGPQFLVTPVTGFKVFRIFNKWGELIFETKDYNKRWDGKFKGMPQSTGSYVYYVQLECKGKNVSLKGTLTLIR